MLGIWERVVLCIGEVGGTFPSAMIELYSAHVLAARSQERGIP